MAQSRQARRPRSQCLDLCLGCHSERVGVALRRSSHALDPLVGGSFEPLCVLLSCGPKFKGSSELPLSLVQLPPGSIGGSFLKLHRLSLGRCSHLCGCTSCLTGSRGDLHPERFEWIRGLFQARTSR